MKKNKAMRTGAALLVCTLLSTSVLSGTLAKYTSTDSASDAARVAKFGVVITAAGNLYGQNYATGETSIPTTETDATKLSVKSSDTSDVLAPGTKSEHGLSFDINGTPEVRTKVDVTVKAQDIYLGSGSYAVMEKVPVDAVSFDSMKTNLYTESSGAYTKVTSSATYSASGVYYQLVDFVQVGSDGYYPVTYTNTGDISFSGKTKITEIAKQISDNVQASQSDSDTTTAGASYTATATLDPNKALSTLKLASNNISWTWAFSADATADAEDTILGDLTAGSTVVKCTIDSSKTAVTDVTAVTVLSVDTDGIVKAGTTETGSVKTSFDVEITATQVD